MVGSAIHRLVPRKANREDVRSGRTRTDRIDTLDCLHRVESFAMNRTVQRGDVHCSASELGAGLKRWCEVGGPAA